MMEFSGKYLLLCLVSALSCYLVTGQQTVAKTDNIATKQRFVPAGVTGRRNIMLPIRGGAGTLSSGIRNFRSKSFVNRQHLQSFNRPEGTEGLIIKANDNQGSETQYGRTFGQYGSYKKHKSWQNAVVDDMQRNFVMPEDLKIKFPWIMNQLHTPSINGFGLNGFWNSYALPEGPPKGKGLGSPIVEQGQAKQR